MPPWEQRILAQIEGASDEGHRALLSAMLDMARAVREAARAGTAAIDRLEALALEFKEHRKEFITHVEQERGALRVLSVLGAAMIAVLGWIGGGLVGDIRAERSLNVEQEKQIVELRVIVKRMDEDQNRVLNALHLK